MRGWWGDGATDGTRKNELTSACCMFTLGPAAWGRMASWKGISSSHLMRPRSFLMLQKKAFSSAATAALAAPEGDTRRRKSEMSPLPSGDAMRSQWERAMSRPYECTTSHERLRVVPELTLAEAMVIQYSPPSPRMRGSTRVCTDSPPAAHAS